MVPRAVVVFGFVFAATLAGCDTIFSGGNCTCHCLCADTSYFCGSTTSPQGTSACEADCVAQQGPNTTCDDSSFVPPPPHQPPPTMCTAQTPSLFITVQYCETCTANPPQEKDVIGHGCTEPDAKAQAQTLATSDGPDCTLAIGHCGAS